MEAWVKYRYVRWFRGLSRERQGRILDVKRAMEWAGAWERFNGGAVPRRLRDKPHVMAFLALEPGQREEVLRVLRACEGRRKAETGNTDQGTPG